MPTRLFLAGAAVALSSCSSPAEVAERTGAAPGATTGPAASATASARAQGNARAVSEETDLYSFKFSYPAAAGAIAPLAARLDDEAEKARAELIAEAKAAQAEAQKEGFPYHAHSYGAEWQTVADISGFLSLSNLFSTYTGGAHGMYGMQGYVWDKRAGRGFDSADLFTSKAALQSALGDALCDALNRERVEKRGAPIDPGDELFSGCPGLDEATVLVGSSNAKTFDRITVWYGPYVAGSYAEGAYELDFPMSPAMVAAVKPAYRVAFSAKR
ncbi:DUF4163 domain-containing protein [Altererythrobacter aerius]|uniref:DUF4163 domain-containing protein n=1 Tax=Tsuneonella aeria TaxID=1837929 RepID=A0A6I4TCU9_9SPHN|nr:DUF4163 domain-containing protein [Tsuneonella aeria]MXO74604.1 DUF4163 domain-containing protein [Tsuneonella aeria]